MSAGSVISRGLSVCLLALVVGCGGGPESELVARLRPQLVLQNEPEQVLHVSELREQFSSSDAADHDASGANQQDDRDPSEEDEDGQTASGPRDVALLGVVGGVANPYKESRPEFPFAQGQALFYLADVGVVAESEGHQHAPGEECAFCAAHAEDNSKLLALVQFRDENGKILQVDARQLFDLKEQETVVVQGVATIGAGDTLIVDATGLYVRR